MNYHNDKEDLSRVNTAKEEISPRYEVWFEASPEGLECEEAIRAVRDQIFEDQISSSGRKFTDILFTPEELAQQNRFTFTQKEVNEYHTPQATQQRRRTLKKDSLFEPNVVLGEILSPKLREKREEGLHRPPYEKMLVWNVTKRLVTSGASPIDILSGMAKSAQLALKEDWIKEDEWIGENQLQDEEVELILAKKMADVLEIDLEELIEYHERVVKINGSSPTYINKHDQHLVPASQGGLSQRPIAIVSHWYEHMLVANDAGEALNRLLKEKELDKENPSLNKLLELTFFAYQMNAQAAELLRNSIPLSPSLSTKHILKKREEVCSQADRIFAKTKETDIQNRLSILSDSDISKIYALANKLVENEGNLHPKGKDFEDMDLPQSYAITLDKLKLVVDLLDRDYAIDKLRSSLRELDRTPKSKLNGHNSEIIQDLIKQLENGQQPIYVDKLTEQQYDAILALQEALDKDILIDIAVPRKIRNVRPAWRYRLDLEDSSDIFINPYNDKGSELRVLLDILENPDFKNIFPTGGPPRRLPFTQENLEDSNLSDKIYGDLRYLDILHGFSANIALNQYYNSVGIENKAEITKAMFPNKYDKEPASTLQNVDEAARIIEEAIRKDCKIATIGDCDQDGFFASINWRWTLEHLGVKNIEQKFNTRIEGHAVQPTDLLNLVLRGNEVIIINDTGSSKSDIETFSMITNGCQNIDCLKFFREEIEEIHGYERISEHEQKQIKKTLSQFIKSLEQRKTHRLYPIEKRSLLAKRITTGETFEDEDGRKYKVHKTLGEYSFIKQFMKGFPETQIIVCDHHTPSVETVKYFMNNNDVVMVNPEWVKKGSEKQFINEMMHALIPDENGKIDVEKLTFIQRKYSCYPELDIVGTVTAGKVMERTLQMLSQDHILKAPTSEIYLLPKTQRMEEYEKLSKLVFNRIKRLQKITLGDKISDFQIDIDIREFWKERGTLDIVAERTENILNAFVDRISKIKTEQLTEQETLSTLEEFEKLWGVKLPNKSRLYDAIQKTDTITVKNLLEISINSKLHKLETDFSKRIDYLFTNGKISSKDLRFYLEYADRLPKSFFLMETEEKEEYIRPIIELLANEITQKSRISANDGVFSVDLSKRLPEILVEKHTLRDIKKELFNLIEQGYEANGGVPANDITWEVPDLRTKVRYEGNKRWNRAIMSLSRKGLLTAERERELNAFLKYGAYGNEFTKLTQATATLGDGGSVDVNRGLENRWRIVDAMNSIEAFVDKYWETDDPTLKQQIKRIEPEILRLVRTSLRGTHMKSVNWHISRLFTHSLAAFVNAMYRRGKDERSEKAKEYWKEASDYCIRRSENYTIQRHRHTLPYAQEVTIETRENLFEGLVKDIELQNGDLHKPILIKKLEGRKFVDPVKGLRGLIAGMLAHRYDKPAMILVEEKPEKDDKPAIYSVSFRLPADGNVATDMVQLSLAMNPVEGINIVGHGGHPAASGGTWEVFGGIERLHEVLDPIFEDFEITNKNAGIINVEDLIKDSIEQLDDGWSDLKAYDEYVNPFEIADIIASQLYKQTNPSGVGLPELQIEFDDLTVVNIAKGTKNDGDDYYSITFRDKRGNLKGMRLFEDLADLAKIQKGDTVTLRAQPLMRLRELEACSLEYNWPITDSSTQKSLKVSTVSGPVSKPHLDITKILNIKHNL